MSAEEVAREMKEASERVAAEEARVLAEKDDQERQARAARKAALNAKWEKAPAGAAPPLPK